MVHARTKQTEKTMHIPYEHTFKTKKILLVGCVWIKDNGFL